MGDGIKLSKDKRHRSSSSIAGVVVERIRSERQLDIRASIPEIEDQFALAEARCDDLQEKINLVKVLKRKRKLKKRSTTRVVDQAPTDENMPFISVQTQPKKKVSQQAARLRRLDVPLNPTRGYVDPAIVEQHRMISQVDGLHTQPNKCKQNVMREQQSSSPLQRLPGSRADGDEMPTAEEIAFMAFFDKAHTSTPMPNRANAFISGDQSLEMKQEELHHNPRRVKYRSRGYELPTVASQIKQAGTRYHANNTNKPTRKLPFIVSKSTAPSHNIGVNIQQVLSGIKMQQPVSGIPPTIARRMGLGHIPSYGAAAGTRQINAICAGGRQQKLFSYRNMPYDQLLALYGEGDGIVPRYLRGVNQSLEILERNRAVGDEATSKRRGGNVHGGSTNTLRSKTATRIRSRSSDDKSCQRN